MLGLSVVRPQVALHTQGAKPAVAGPMSHLQRAAINKKGRFKPAFLWWAPQRPRAAQRSPAA
jgi:hypothetical protein